MKCVTIVGLTGLYVGKLVYVIERPSADPSGEKHTYGWCLNSPHIRQIAHDSSALVHIVLRDYSFRGVCKNTRKLLTVANQSQAVSEHCRQS